MKNLGCLYFVLLVCLIVNAKYNNKTCNCYLLGTVSSVEGESICDEETLQCRCYPNISGLNCDKCVEGYYDILSSEGCSSCFCDTFGSVTNECDILTGQCNCKEGYTGLACNHCKNLKYEFQNKCIDCNCNPDGSKDLQCDEEGKCKCYDNFEGRNCSKCKENTHSSAEGCIPCSSCYGLAQAEINTFQNNLTISQNTLDGIEKKLPLILENYEKFIQEIKILGNKILKLKPQLQESSYGNYHDLFIKFEQKVDSFESELQYTTKKVDNYDNVDITKLIQELDLSLEYDNKLLLQCNEEYQNAVARSGTLENHNNTLTEISKTALTTLQLIQKAVNDFSEHSIKVNESTKEVCSEAENFVQSEGNIATELNNINYEVNNTINTVMTAKGYITEFSYKVSETYQETMILSQQSNQVIIPVNEVNDITDQSVNIKYSTFIINGMMSDVGEITKEFHEELLSTEAYSNNVHYKQNSTNEFFTASRSYESRADYAIQFTNDVFYKGQNDLESFTQYAVMQESIKDLMKDAPNIQGKIDAVQKHSSEAKQIFEELTDVIKENENLKLKTDGLLKIIEGNQRLILSNVKLVETVEEEEHVISAELDKYHAELKNIRYNVDKVNKLEVGTKDKIKEMEGYLLVVDSIPTNEKELEMAQQEIETLENMYVNVDELSRVKQMLEKEVANIKEILESLPIDDKTLCEAPESEPKLGTR